MSFADCAALDQHVHMQNFIYELHCPIFNKKYLFWFYRRFCSSYLDYFWLLFPWLQTSLCNRPPPWHGRPQQRLFHPITTWQSSKVTIKRMRRWSWCPATPQVVLAVMNEFGNQSGVWYKERVKVVPGSSLSYCSSDEWNWEPTCYIVKKKMVRWYQALSKITVALMGTNMIYTEEAKMVLNSS